MNSPRSRLDFDRFEAITFDCYGTLINWEEGILGCLRPILARHKKPADDATILQLFGDFEANAEQGEYRRYRDVLESVVSGFGDHLGFANSGGNPLPAAIAGELEALARYGRGSPATAPAVSPVHCFQRG